MAGSWSLPAGSLERWPEDYERGRRYIEVDACDDSRPILERLGFAAATTTTPNVWSPRAAR